MGDGKSQTAARELVAQRLQCSARPPRRTSICVVRQCPPEGGLYSNAKFTRHPELAPAVFLMCPASFSCSVSLAFRALLQMMLFLEVLRGRVSMNALIGMDVPSPVVPVASPAGIVDEHGVAAPVKAAEARSP